MKSAFGFSISELRMTTYWFSTHISIAAVFYDESRVHHWYLLECLIPSREYSHSEILDTPIL